MKKCWFVAIVTAILVLWPFEAKSRNWFKRITKQTIRFQVGQNGTYRFDFVPELARSFEVSDTTIVVNGSRPPRLRSQLFAVAYGFGIDLGGAHLWPAAELDIYNPALGTALMDNHRVGLQYRRAPDSTPVYGSYRVQPGWFTTLRFRAELTSRFFYLGGSDYMRFALQSVFDPIGVPLSVHSHLEGAGDKVTSLGVLREKKLGFRLDYTGDDPKLESALLTFSFGFGVTWISFAPHPGIGHVDIYKSSDAHAEMAVGIEW